jgi:hypothetical protein
MQRSRQSEEGDGIISLVKETADGLGRLIADHVKLARIEIVADAKTYGRDLTALVVASLVVVLGYGFAWTAGALALGRVIGAPIAFGAVALLHLVAGLVALTSAVRKMRKARLMRETASEVSRSVTALSGPIGARSP